MPRGAAPAALAGRLQSAPAAAIAGYCVLAGRGLYQCNRCKKQTSPTAGTIFHATKLPLTLWFAAIHLIVTAKNGISSVELGRRLGVKQPTAWAVKHKIMAVMARREGETPLTGRVEMDDAYLGGVRSGGKRGRGAAGKTPFVAAVSTSPEGRPAQAEAGAGQGLPQARDRAWRQALAGPRRGGCDGRLGLLEAHSTRSPAAIRQSAPGRADRRPAWRHSNGVNTMLGNIKCAITGTYRKLGPDHAGRYLVSFAWRYNRRYQLETMIPRFVHSAARTEPHALSPPHRRMTFKDKQENQSDACVGQARFVCVRRNSSWGRIMNIRHVILSAVFAFGIVMPGQAADISAGKDIAVTVCAACHGANGVSVSSRVPNLAAQRAGYIEKQLKAYRSKKRKHGIMSGLVGHVSDAVIADVAAYYASLPGAPSGAAKSKPPANYIAKRVALPANMQGLTHYFTFNHKRRKQLRNVYANTVALEAARAGKEAARRLGYRGRGVQGRNRPK